MNHLPWNSIARSRFLIKLDAKKRGGKRKRKRQRKSMKGKLEDKKKERGKVIKWSYEEHTQVFLLQYEQKRD